MSLSLAALMIPLASYHFSPNDYNERNLGLIAEFRNGVVVGAYRNSFDKTTALAGVRSVFARAGDAEFAYMLGACTGYRLPICGQLSTRIGPLELGIVPNPRAVTLTLVIRKDVK